MKKIDDKKVFAPSFMYNVLPGFFGEKIVLQNKDLKVDCINDFLLIKDNQIILYMSGGGLNQKAFLTLKNNFNKHISR
ncbi:MAG: hypothetical protein JXJ04_09180, partial [Spirochaetales bacterium]|nr:hypothetical protein [Spirochaetales bacterium]